LENRYVQAAATSKKAQLYYQNIVEGISTSDLEAWELEIQVAESSRLNDRSAMDILGAREFNQDIYAASAESDRNSDAGSAGEWIQLAMDMEEKQ
jgi:hypothetical protein